MKTQAELYQERMAESMSFLQNTLSSDEYFFANIDDLCGDEIFDIFRKVSEISNGLIVFLDGEIKATDDSNHIVLISYQLNYKNEIREVKLSFKLNNGISASQIANELNELFISNDYISEKYFFDISQDVGKSGLAFSIFEKEKVLFENGIVWRGSDFENSEGYEYFWKKYWLTACQNLTVTRPLLAKAISE